MGLGVVQKDKAAVPHQKGHPRAKGPSAQVSAVSYTLYLIIGYSSGLVLCWMMSDMTLSASL